MLITLAHLAGLAELEPIQVNQVYRVLLREEVPAPTDEVVDHGHVLLLEVYGLLVHSAGLVNEQVLGILTAYRDPILAYGRELGTVVLGLDEEATVPQLQIGIVDNRWVTVSGCDGYHDIVNGGRVRELPTMPLIMVSYLLSTLYLRQHRRWRVAMERNDADPADTAETLPDEPR